MVFTQVCDFTVHYTLSANGSACGGTWTAVRDIPFHWVRESACASTFTYTEFDPCTGNTATHEDALTWPADHGYLPSLPGQRAFNDYVNGQLWHSFTEGQDPPAVERVDISTSSESWPDDYNANWSESSDVDVRLFTGGKALRQSQGLFDLSAGLDYADCLDTTVSDWCANTYWGLFLWLDDPPVAVPSEDIALGGLGNLGPDGHLWTVQSDNIEVIITPHVTSCRSASALAASPVVATGIRGGPPGQQKYHPYITLSTATTNANLDTDTPEVCVGQQVTLTLSGLPAYQEQVGHWILPQKYVNEPWQLKQWVVPPLGNGYWDYYGSVNYRINTDLLTNLTTQCWYVNRPGGTVTAAWNLKLPNGHQISLISRGRMSVVKPSVDRIESSYQTYFHANNGVDISASMDWKIYVRPPPHFSGTAAYAQLIQRDWDFYREGLLGATHVTDSTGGEYWLDNTYPYPETFTAFLSWDDDPEKHADHSDSPGLSGNLCVSVALADKFKTYLQFQPTGSGSIAVTIGRIDWDWSCSATETSGIWTWTLPKHGPTPDWGDDSFPVWEVVYMNHSL